MERAFLTVVLCMYRKPVTGWRSRKASSVKSMQNDLESQPSKLRPFLVAMATKILELVTKLEPKSPAWRLKLRRDWKHELNLATKIFHWWPNLSSRWPILWPVRKKVNVEGWVKYFPVPVPPYSFNEYSIIASLVRLTLFGNSLIYWNIP